MSHLCKRPPWGARKSSQSIRRRHAGGLGLATGFGLLILMPGAVAAQGRGYSHGHAEVTLGFPRGQITVGRTWEDDPREVVVEKVTHKFPETDFEEEEGDNGEEGAIEEDAPEERVII